MGSVSGDVGRPEAIRGVPAARWDLAGRGFLAPRAPEGPAETPRVAPRAGSCCGSVHAYVADAACVRRGGAVTQAHAFRGGAPGRVQPTKLADRSSRDHHRWHG